VFQESDDTLVFLNKVKNEPVLVIFGAWNPAETSHQMIINVSTSPVKCSHCTLWKTDNFH